MPALCPQKAAFCTRLFRFPYADANGSLVALKSTRGDEAGERPEVLARGRAGGARWVFSMGVPWFFFRVRPRKGFLLMCYQWAFHGCHKFPIII